MWNMTKFKKKHTIEFNICNFLFFTFLHNKSKQVRIQVNGTQNTSLFTPGALNYMFTSHSDLDFSFF